MIEKINSATLNIVPDPTIRDSGCSGTLEGLTVARIDAVLGFTSNRADDGTKVENSWSFTVDGRQGAIWDYKRSHERGVFSFWGAGHMPFEAYVRPRFFKD